MLEPIETPIGVNAQVIDSSDLPIIIIEFKQKGDKDAKFVKE